MQYLICRGVERTFGSSLLPEIVIADTKKKNIIVRQTDYLHYSKSKI